MILFALSCEHNVCILFTLKNVLIRNKLLLRNHFRDQFANLLHKEKEHLALRNNFRVTKKFLIAKFDRNSKWNEGRIRVDN